MAEVTGTAGDDFIHAAGDGRNPPPGFNEVVGVTDGSDSITGGLGVDYSYGAGGDDIFFFNNAQEINGLSETIDGGSGTSDTLITNFGGLVDLTEATLISVEGLAIQAIGIDTDIFLTANQMAGFTAGIGTSAPSQILTRIVLVDSGVITLNQTILGLGVDSIIGASGDDSFTITAITSNLTISGEGGDDLIDFTYQSRIPPVTITLSGGEGDDSLSGGRAMFLLDGGAGNDRLEGSKLDDTLDGGEGMDRLLPGFGADVMTGGAGEDRFLFKSPFESEPGAADVITDFSGLEGDRINLARIDANTKQAGDQAFRYVGDSFTGRAGQLIAFIDEDDRTVLQGDRDGNGVADFELILLGAPTLTGADLVL